MARRIAMAFLLLTGVLTAGPARAGWVLWDDFSVPVLDSSRWRTSRDDADHALEKLLFVDALLFPNPDPQLFIVRRLWAVGFQLIGNALDLKAKTTARGIEALVTPVFCIGVPGYLAGLTMENAGYLAQLFLDVDCPGLQQGLGNKIIWRIFRNNPDGTRTQIAEGTFGGKPLLGQPQTLRIARTGNVFRFVLATNAGLEQQDQSVPPDGTDGTADVEVEIFGQPSQGDLIIGVGVDKVSVDLP